MIQSTNDRKTFLTNNNIHVRNNEIVKVTKFESTLSLSTSILFNEKYSTLKYSCNGIPPPDYNNICDMLNILLS